MLLRLMLVLEVIAFSVMANDVLAQSNIAPGYQCAWSENIGWTNWLEADGGVGGVTVHDTFLSGYIWSENVGWINVGNGSPADGNQYANSDSSDFGVNIDLATGYLSGLAWGENIGWINFDTLAALESYNLHARFELTSGYGLWTGRFRGYVWSENIGWINLDHDIHYVAAFACNDPFANVDGDTDVDQTDFGIWQLCFSGADIPSMLGCECFDRPTAGLSYGDNDVDADDLAAFQACVGGPTVDANPKCDD